MSIKIVSIANRKYLQDMLASVKDFKNLPTKVY